MNTLLVIVFLMAFGQVSTRAEALMAEKQTYFVYPMYNYSFFTFQYSNILSEPLDVLPEGFLTILVDGTTYYYHQGVFYQKNFKEQKYLVVSPPIGAVVPSIPSGYRMMIVQGTTLYEYNGVFYKRGLEGYKVVEPPDSFF